MLQQLLRQFEINESFFIMMLLFVATFVLMQWIALRRLSNTLVERDHRMHGREEKSEKLRSELSGLQSRLRGEISQARREAQQIFLELKEKAAAEQRNLLGTARERAAQQIQAARKEVEEKIASESARLEAEVPLLAKMILDQILGGQPQPPSKISQLSSEA